MLFVARIKDVIDDTLVMPADRESAAGKMWVRDNAKAMFLISSAMEYDCLEPLVCHRQEHVGQIVPDRRTKIRVK